MLKIAICDDNKSICAEIENMILEYEKNSYTQFEIEVFYTGESMINFIKTEHSFDLIFLDIELGTTTGIKVGTIIREEFDDYISKIVFITSKDGYEQELFDVQPLNFIKKPINYDKVIKCLDLTIKLLGIDNKTFEYKKGYDFIKVDIKDILYFEKIGRKIKIVTNCGEDFFNDTISNIKRNLTQNFVQPHETFLINYNKIISFNSKIIIMSDKNEIPISKAKLSEIRTMLINNLREK